MISSIPSGALRTCHFFPTAKTDQGLIFYTNTVAEATVSNWFCACSSCSKGKIFVAAYQSLLHILCDCYQDTSSSTRWPRLARSSLSYLVARWHLPACIPYWQLHTCAASHSLRLLPGYFKFRSMASTHKVVTIVFGRSLTSSSLHPILATANFT